MQPPEQRFTRLHLCRHGEVAADWSARIYGGRDVPTAPEARRRFERLAAELAGQELDAIYASALARAREGAEILARPHGLRVRIDPRLNEIDRGWWAGLTLAEVEGREPGAWRAYLEDPDGYAGHGGESHAALRARVIPCLQEIAARHPGGRVLAVTHGQVMRVAVAWVLGIGGRESLRLMHSLGGITTIDAYEDGEWVVQAVNAPALRPEPWGGRTRKP